MTLNNVTVTFTIQDAGDDAGTGLVTVAPTGVITAAGVAVVSATPVTRPLGGGTASVQVVATDNAGTNPAAGFWAYQISLPGQPAGLYLVPFANGATQRFDQLVPVVPVVVYAANPAAVAYVPLNGATMAGFLAPRVFALAQSGGNVAVDWSQGNVATLAMTASGWTISNPVNPVNGQVIRMRFRQDSTGSRTLAGWGNAYDWGSGNSAPVFSAAAAASDVVAFEWDADAGTSGRAVYLAAPFPQAFGL